MLLEVNFVKIVVLMNLNMRKYFFLRQMYSQTSQTKIIHWDLEVLYINLL